MLNNLAAIAGRTIEKIILKAIQERYAVVATAEIETHQAHGPRLDGNGLTASLPDAQIYGANRAGWLEVKAKSSASYFRNFSRWEHGIDRDKYTEYQKVGRATGLPVYLIICDLADGNLLMSDLDTLRTSGKPRVGKWPDGKPSINWDKKAFKVVGSVEIKSDDLRQVKVSYDWPAIGNYIRQLSMAL